MQQQAEYAYMHEGGLSKGGSRVVFLVAMATLAAFF